MINNRLDEMGSDCEVKKVSKTICNATTATKFLTRALPLFFSLLDTRRIKTTICSPSYKYISDSLMLNLLYSRWRIQQVFSSSLKVWKIESIRSGEVCSEEFFFFFFRWKLFYVVIDVFEFFFFLLLLGSNLTLTLLAIIKSKIKKYISRVFYYILLFYIAIK